MSVVPSDDMVMDEILRIKAECPELGIQRISGQLHREHPAWLVNAKRVRRLLRQQREEAHACEDEDPPFGISPPSVLQFVLASSAPPKGKGKYKGKGVSSQGKGGANALTSPRLEVTQGGWDQGMPGQASGGHLSDALSLQDEEEGLGAEVEEEDGMDAVTFPPISLSASTDDDNEMASSSSSSSSSCSSSSSASSCSSASASSPSLSSSSCSTAIENENDFKDGLDMEAQQQQKPQHKEQDGLGMDDYVEIQLDDAVLPLAPAPPEATTQASPATAAEVVTAPATIAAGIAAAPLHEGQGGEEKEGGCSAGDQEWVMLSS